MRFTLFCFAAIWLTACGSPSPAPADAIADAIRSSPSIGRIHALNAAAHRHRGDVSSLAPLLDAADPDVRFGAVYVASLWADDAADIAALAPLLDDPNEGIRAMVAGSLAGLEHDRAREVLGALRASAAPMPSSDPPITVGRFTTDVLERRQRAGRQ